VLDEYTADAGVTVDGVLCKDGVIPDSAYPNALLLDGSRAMTGNLDMGDNPIVDLDEIRFNADFSIDIHPSDFYVRIMNRDGTAYKDFRCNKFFSYMWQTVGTPGILHAGTGASGGIRCQAYSSGVTYDVWEVLNSTLRMDIMRAGDITGLAGRTLTFPNVVIQDSLDCDGFDIPATSVSGLSAVIPVIVGGVTKYIPVYDSYA